MNRFVAIITALVTAFTLRCGTSGLAGAAGSGNPGGSAVSLAIVADGLRSGDGLGKHTVEPQQLRADLSAGLPIPDLDSMHFTADSMFVTVQRVRFVPAGDSTCARLIDAFPGDGLRCDSGSVNIDGPFTFNALTGECTPPLDSLPVPAAGYGAIRLDFPGDGPPQQATAGPASIRVVGTFILNDTLRSFILLSRRSGTLTLVPSGGVISAQAGRLTLCTVELHAGGWFDSLELGGCIASGAIPLETDGSLLLDHRAFGGPCADATARIRENMMGTAGLRVETRQ